MVHKGRRSEPHLGIRFEDGSLPTYKTSSLLLHSLEERGLNIPFFLGTLTSIGVLEEFPILGLVDRSETLSGIMLVEVRFEETRGL